MTEEPRLEHVSRLIGDIYQAAYGGSSRQRLVQDICDLFHGSRACFVTFDAAQWHDVVATVDDADAHSPASHAAFMADPMRPAISAAPEGRAYVERAILGTTVRDPEAASFLRARDMDDGLVVRLPDSASRRTFLDVRRGFAQDTFESPDLRLADALAPHLARAAVMGRQQSVVQASFLIPEAMPFGIVVVDSAQRIVTLNSAADIILRQPDSVITAQGGHLRVRDNRSAVALRALIGASCTVAGDLAPSPGGDLMLRADRAASQAKDIVVSVAPFTTQHDDDPWRGAQALLCLREVRLDLPADFESMARSFYGFTAKEARLAQSLAEGRSLRQAAEIEGIAFSTARSYLENIFAKTDCRRQSQLVALLRAARPLRLM